MKEEYLLNLIEAGFKGYHQYHQALDVFINHLYSEYHITLARKVRKIQDDNLRVIKCEEKYE